jgi:hypothetical protein
LEEEIKSLDETLLGTWRGSGDESLKIAES